MTAVDLKAAVQNLEALPTMPVVAQKILGLQLDTDEGEAQLLRLIEKDPQIAAKIIGLANAPLFGASKRVTAVNDAAMLLGITRVKSVALGIAVMSTLTQRPVGKLNIQQLWLHSLAVALAMRTLSRAMPARSRPLDDEIFLAGLLHDIGYLVLNYLDPARSDALQDRLATDHEREATAIEAEIIDVPHSELGAELARRWDLPDHIVAVIRHHHNPSHPQAQSGQPLVHMVGLAEKLLPSFGMAEFAGNTISDAEWQSLGIDPAKSEEILATIREQSEQAKQVAATFS